MKIRKGYLSVFLFVSSIAFAGADSQFLHEMTMHHQQAIDMAKMSERKLVSSQVKKMNSKILKEQKKEVSQMNKWKKKVDAGTVAATEAGDEHGKMNMNMPMDMSEMKDLGGRDFDIKYLEMMSAHHGQAISMVEKYRTDLSNSDVKRFAEKIAKVQGSEIEKMEKLKKEISSQ